MRKNLKAAAAYTTVAFWPKLLTSQKVSFRGRPLRESDGDGDDDDDDKRGILHYYFVKLPEVLRTSSKTGYLLKRGLPFGAPTASSSD